MEALKDFVTSEERTDSNQSFDKVALEAVVALVYLAGLAY
jgi:hypothetical protein